jgi:predicted HicB family RNase H-like nuclease
MSGEIQKPRKEATSIKVDPDLWKEAKIEAIKRDMELGELVEHALRQELKHPTMTSPKIKQQTIRGSKL